MKNVDLEKYKSVWKNERSFDERKLSENEILKFMKSSSKSIVSLFKRGLIFDIIFKIALLVSLVFLFFIIPNQNSFKYLSIFIILIDIIGIVYQMNVLNTILHNNKESQSVADKLHDYIDFYHNRYIKSIYIGALSSSLLFLTGSIYYFYFKYQELPKFEIDDFVVLSIGIFLSYGLSAFVQLKQNNFRIKQLEKSLKEIDENTFTEQVAESYKSRRIRNILFISILLCIGLLLLIFLLYQIKH